VAARAGGGFATQFAASTAFEGVFAGFEQVGRNLISGERLTQGVGENILSSILFQGASEALSNRRQALQAGRRLWRGAGERVDDVLEALSGRLFRSVDEVPNGNNKGNNFPASTNESISLGDIPGGQSRKADDNTPAWLPEATGARWGKDIPLSDSTGLDDYTRYIEYADAAYIAIRNSSDDVAVIARNIGWPQYRIQRIKNHVFNNKHQLDDAFRQFDADPDIADAWARLQRDDFVPEDIRLLEHEYFESRFESIFRTNYRDAHNATIRSGRTWNPNP